MNEDQPMNDHHLHIEPCPCGNIHPEVSGDDCDGMVDCDTCGRSTPGYCHGTKSAIKWWNLHRNEFVPNIPVVNPNSRFKFRVWNKTKNIWNVENDALRIDGSDKLVYLGMDWESDLDENTIEQFTGMKDKNDKDIYEGDILTGDTYDTIFNSLVCQYEKEYGGFSFCYSLGKNQDFKYWFKQLKNLVVIGNIHENPNLLVEK